MVKESFTLEHHCQTRHIYTERPPNHDNSHGAHHSQRVLMVMKAWVCDLNQKGTLDSRYNSYSQYDRKLLAKSRTQPVYKEPLRYRYHRGYKQHPKTHLVHCLTRPPASISIFNISNLDDYTSSPPWTTLWIYSPAAFQLRAHISESRT